MFEQLREEILRLLEGPASDAEVPGFNRETVAAAALLVECARIDSEFSEEERESVQHIVQEFFDLDPQLAEMLVGIAEKRFDEVWDDWLFTQAVKKGFDLQKRAELIDRLWEVAQADGVLHRFESFLVQRLAEELDVTPELVRKLRAKKREDEKSGGRKS